MLRTAAALALVLGSMVAAVAGQRAQTPPGSDYQRLLPLIAVEDRRDPTPAELRVIVEYANNTEADPDLANAAVQTLGRLERRELIPVLLDRLNDRVTRDAAALGLLLTLRAHAPQEPGDEEIGRIGAALLAASGSPAIVSEIPYQHADQVLAAENKLRRWLDESEGPRAAAARGLETLVRRNRKLRFVLDEQSSALLKRAATWALPKMDRRRDQALMADGLAALATAGLLDADLIASAQRESNLDARLTAARALVSAGANVDPDRRTALVLQALRDPEPSVRYEGLRAWARRETAENGCQPIIEALGDRSPHVMLAAMDALGTSCLEDPAITDSVAAEARTPPTVGSWHREAHALVALARRDPEKAAVPVSQLVSHQVWQVRMYTARAAALIKDAVSLERLAYDSHDNVREEALPSLRLLKGAESDAAMIAGLSRRDPQLLRTIANTLKGASPSSHLLNALVGAFERLTAEKKDTARDTRIALLERILEQGGAAQASRFEKLATDYDEAVATTAASMFQQLTGRRVAVTPRPLPRPPLPTPVEMRERVVARVTLDTGEWFNIGFDRTATPLAYARFARLARAGYYNGLTFHRVVPNFVVQGGSPGANEYAGDALFMRDELTTATHRRGAVGISTRGRHTGDAQIFINLVANPALDFDYTVLGHVVDNLDVIDTIQEGTVIRRVEMTVRTIGR